MPTARVLAKGQIVIPKLIRDKAKIAVGDKVNVEMTSQGIVIVPIKETYTQKVRGIAKGRLTTQELEDLYAEKP